MDEGGGGNKIVDSYGGVSLHNQSHGESFFSLFIHKFKEEGLYLLDEPEAALSPNKQMQMIARLHQLVNSGSQFVIATHSPILLSYRDAEIYQFGSDGINKVAYEDTEVYQLYKGFINNTTLSLRELGVIQGIDNKR